MKTLSSDTKFAHLGKPGTSFSKGFQRRLDIITKLVDFKNKVILDQACGEGVWLNEFAEFTSWENIYGFDIDAENISQLKIESTKHKAQSSKEILKSKNRKIENIPYPTSHISNHFKVCPAEELDFPDNFFDIVFSNEVFEHFNDDKKAAAEALRVLKPGGKLIVFTPNRGWPFETHGMFLRGKYYWGNIPLLPWMPKFVRRKFSPHVRNYSNGEIKKLFNQSRITNYELRTESTKLKAQSSKEIENQKSKNENISDPTSHISYRFKIVYHSHVFPAFDKLERKFGILGRGVQKFFRIIEKTPLHWFGISHLVILEKTDTSK